MPYAPGIMLSTFVAVGGYLGAPYVGRVVPIPSMVIALVIGIALGAVALLGLRGALADVTAL